MKDKRKTSAFILACQQQATPYTPVWIMRQAGRYMKDYRDLRSRVSFLELCKSPELVCQATLMASQQLGVDAAIIFSDILLIAEPLGFGLEFSSGHGPVIPRPFRHAHQLKDASTINISESLKFVGDAVATTRAALPDNLPLIGFAGAPFTVASYILEGGKTKHFEHTKKLMHGDCELWHKLMTLMAQSTKDYLLMQINAGADAIMLFDSWVGTLSLNYFKQYALPYVKTIFQSLKSTHPNIPLIYFGAYTPHLITELAQTQANVIGLDFHHQADVSADILGPHISIQGNLDPTVLLTSPAVIKREVEALLNQMKSRPGYIFNLGHGILPNTPEDHAKYLIDLVHGQL